MATPYECAQWRSQLEEKNRFITVWMERERAAADAWNQAWRDVQSCERERDDARREWEGDRDNGDKIRRLANAEMALASAKGSTEAAGQQMAEARDTRSALANAARDIEFRISQECSGV